MYRFYNLFRGYAVLRVQGAFCERFLNICAARGVELWGMRRVSPLEMELCLPLSSLTVISELSLRAGVSAELKRKAGLPVLAGRLKRRWMLVAGGAFTVIALFILSLFVWEIRIVGNEGIASETILQQLKEAGLDVGTLKSRVKSAELKNAMLLRVSELEWLAVNIRGSCATVELREVQPKPEMLREDEPCNVVAAKDGLITSIDTRSGSALVKPGDAVKKGQLLVSGLIDSRIVGARYVHALAEVEARTWYELETAMPVKYQGKRYTGAVKKRYAIILFGFRINLYFGSSQGYEHCDIMTQTDRLRVPPGLSLPFEMVTELCSEYEPTDYSVDAQVAESLLKASLEKRLEGLVTHGAVLESNFSGERSGQAQRMTLSAECVESIARTEVLIVEKEESG